MPLALACASHTPLIHEGTIAPEDKQAVTTAFAELARHIREFQPDCIVQFFADHLNGFFYDLMPSFCVAVEGESLGDWGGGTGPLPVDSKFALAIADAARDADIDVALSYRMKVDHGFVQIWETMFGNFRDYPVVPIFINCAAPPIPKYRRARMLGEAVGRFVSDSGKRVLLAASGGLSHDPPLPQLTTAPPDVRERLIDGRNPTADAREVRVNRVLDAGRLAAQGQGPCQPLNPEWDRKFLDLLRSGKLAEIDKFTPEGVRKEAGCGANEVLGWVAAFAALSTAGPYKFDMEFYKPIPGWIAGMAIVGATPVST